MPPKAKQPKQPKMRKPRAARAGRAGKSAAGKAGLKQSQKIIVQLGDRQPFAFPQQNQLTIQDIIKLVSTRGKRLGDREEEEQPPLTTGGIVGAGPLMPEPVKPNIAALGSRLLNPTDDFSPEAGSIELLKTEIKPKPIFTDTSSNIEIMKPVMKPKPILIDTSSNIEIIKPKQISSYLKDLSSLKPETNLSNVSSNIEIMKSVMKPKPILSEEAGSIEIMKSQIKPKPVFTEEAGSIELNKSKAPKKKKQTKLEFVEVQPAELQPKPAATVEEVFNRPIPTKSLFEQIAKTQPPAEAYPDIPPYPMEIIPKQKPPRKDKGIPRGSIKERVFAEGVEQGIDIGVATGRDVQNTEVMNVEQLQARKIQPGQLKLIPNEQNQPASSSSDINFA